MGYILEASGGFHWKAHSSVDITNGQPLGSTIKSRRPLRRQQSALLTRKSTTYPSKSHWRVQELAAAKAKEIEAWEKASHESRDAAPNADITVSEFYTSVYLPWLETHVKTGQKAYATLVSIKRYWKAYLADHFNGTKTFKNYQPYLGSQFLQDLRRDDGKPYGESTIRQIHSTASGIFAKAILEGYTDYQVNPWHAIPIKDMVFINAEQGEAFTEKNVERMITNLEATNATEESGWTIQLAQCVLAVGIWAGLRPSEVAAMQWQSVDLGAATLTVRKAYVYGKEKSTTKTGKERVVPFRDKLAPVLRHWWETNGRPESGWVFPNRDGNPINMDNLSDRIIQPNCEKSGLT